MIISKNLPAPPLTRFWPRRQKWQLSVGEGRGVGGTEKDIGDLKPQGVAISNELSVVALGAFLPEPLGGRQKAEVRTPKIQSPKPRNFAVLKVENFS